MRTHTIILNLEKADGAPPPADLHPGTAQDARQVLPPRLIPKQTVKLWRDVTRHTTQHNISTRPRGQTKIV